MRKKLALVLSLGLMALSFGGVSHGAVTAGDHMIEYYPDNGAYSFCDKESLPGTSVQPTQGKNFGAVCQEVVPGRTVKIKKIEDDFNTLFRLSYLFMDANMNSLGDPTLQQDPVAYLTVSPSTYGSTCTGHTTALAVPTGAKYFYVFVNGFANTNCGAGYGATHGFITITTT